MVPDIINHFAKRDYLQGNVLDL